MTVIGFPYIPHEAPMNWRKLEDELVDILRKEGLELDESYAGDKVVKQGDLILFSITYLAQTLANRGLT